MSNTKGEYEIKAKGVINMTVEHFSEMTGFTAIILPDKSREVQGAYVGDLLSWVMGRAKSDNAWITIMSNLNVIAVATLTDVSCVIFAEGVVPDKELIDVAESKGVNLLKTEMSSYDTAVTVSRLLS